MSNATPRATEMVHEQLRLELSKHLGDRYDPMLVYVDGEYHYLKSPEETQCGKDVPNPVPALRTSDWKGPSTKACGECNPYIGQLTKKKARRQIANHLEGDITNSHSFTKEALVELLKIVEGYDTDSNPD